MNRLAINCVSYKKLKIMWWKKILSAILSLFVVYVGLRVVFTVTVGSFWDKVSWWILPFMIILAFPLYVIFRKLMFPNSMKS